jgi:hypothetical protein
MTIQDFRLYQQYIKKQVEAGNMTKLEGIDHILDVSIQMLQDLKMPITDPYLDEQAKDNEYQMNNFN